MILSQVNGIYDPLGLATPFIIRAKLLLRNFSIENVGWDDPMSAKTREDWISFFIEMFDMEVITFRRCIKSKDAIGKPVLVIFNDASENAFGACAYVR